MSIHALSMRAEHHCGGRCHRRLCGAARL